MEFPASTSYYNIIFSNPNIATPRQQHQHCQLGRTTETHKFRNIFAIYGKIHALAVN